MTNRHLLHRLSSLNTRLDTILLAYPNDEEESEKTSTGQKVGAVAGGIGGAAAGLMVPGIARKQWQQDLPAMKTHATKMNAEAAMNRAGVPQLPGVRPKFVRAGNVLKQANWRTNSAVGRMGTKGRLVGAGVLGAGGALLGAAAGKFLDPGTYRADEDKTPVSARMRF